jgi:hypothetical protein
MYAIFGTPVAELTGARPRPRIPPFRRDLIAAMCQSQTARAVPILGASKQQEAMRHINAELDVRFTAFCPCTLHLFVAELVFSAARLFQSNLAS